MSEGITANQLELGVVTVLSVRVELTDAQIKALPTTLIEAIPAPGAGKVIMPVMMYGALNSTAGAYAENVKPGIQYTEEHGEITNPIIFFSGVAGIRACYATPFDQLPIPDTAINSPLFIESQDVADYTGGHASNTLKITVGYIIIDV